MQLNEESGVGGYIVEPKSMVDPHTGEYVTIQNSINIEETDELPEGVKPIDVFSDEFLHMNFASKEPADDEVNEELKRLYALKKSFTQKENKRKATEKSKGSGRTEETGRGYGVSENYPKQWSFRRGTSVND